MKGILLQIIFVFCTFISNGASQWIQRADFAGSGRHRAAAVSVANKGYLGLGHINGTGVETYFSDWWEYDPATNSWAQKADFIGNNGNGELGARTIGLETVCYVGLGELDQYSLYKYNPATNIWTQVTSAPAGNTFRDTQEMIYGHKAYFTDLYNDELYEYNCDTDQWTYKGLLPFQWYFVFSGFTIEDKIYVKAYDQLWMYDPALNSWTFKNFFPGFAGLASNCFVQNGKAYIINGHDQNDHTSVTSEVWQYDPSTEQWTQLEDFPGTDRRYSTQFTIGNRCFLGTGTNGTNFNDFWEFNAVAGEDEMNGSKFTVGPIPSNSTVTFRSDEALSFSVTLFDRMGNKVQSVTSENGAATIEKGNLSEGNYHYRIESEGKPLDNGALVFL